MRFLYDGENWLMVNGPDAYDLAKNAIPKTQRGATNGVASLDAYGKIPLEQIPEGVGERIKLEVTAASGTIVTVVNGATILSKTSSGTVTFELPRFGDWTITAGEYEKIITIDAIKVYKIQALPLSEATWAQIAAISESGNAADTWSIGDEKDIVIGDETLTLVIVDFNHDDLADGSGKASITFGLKHLMAEKRRMNSTSTNVGGFTGSEMYEWLQGDLLNSLPQDLKAVLKSVNKKTSAGNAEPTINTDAMQVFLFSEIEVYGIVNLSFDGEGLHYPYFATKQERRKELANGTGGMSGWWLRSPVAARSFSFCNVDSTGDDAGDVYALYSSGVCFGFCV